MKRPTKWILSAIAIVIALALVLPWLIPARRISDLAQEHVSSLLGVNASFRNSGRITYNPFLGFELADMLITPREGVETPIVRAERLRGRLSLRSLLTGKISVDRWVLVRPEIDLGGTIDGNGTTLQHGVLQQTIEASRKARSDDPSAVPAFAGFAIGNFEIEDGVIRFGTGDETETLTSVNATLDWPTSTSALNMKGTAIWRDESSRLSLTLAEPMAVFAGGQSAIKTTAISDAGNASFSGAINTIADMHLIGELSIASPSLRRLGRLFRTELESGTTLGEFSARGKLSGTPKQANLNEAEIIIDGNSARGEVGLLRPESGMPVISATMAFSTLSLTPYFEALQQETEVPARDLTLLRLARQFDADVRLSASTVNLGPISGSELAGSYKSRAGEVTLDIGNLTVLGSSLSGAIVARPDDGKIQLQAEGAFSGLATGQIASMLPGTTLQIAAAAKGTVTAKGDGALVSELANSLRYNIAAKTGPGTISGLDLAAIAKSTPGSEPAAGGQTAISASSADLVLLRNHVWARSLTLTGDDLEARMTGRLNFRTGALALRATVIQPQPPFSFSIGGNIREPLIFREERDQ